MKNVNKKLFVLVSVDQLSSGCDLESSLVFTDYDLSSSKKYIKVDEVTVFLALPDDVTGIAADKLQDELEAMRARHHVEQQAIIDRIAGLRLLSAPAKEVEGDLLDDSDLVKREKKIDDSEATDADWINY